MGALEPNFDCPDCAWEKTGAAVGPHAFREHLIEEHGYDRPEAIEIAQRNTD